MTLKQTKLRLVRPVEGYLRQLSLQLYSLRRAFKTVQLSYLYGTSLYVTCKQNFAQSVVSEAASTFRLS